jgi:peptide/nickel transport system permease protein
MTAYLIRRVGTSLVILIGISIFVFVLLHSVFPSPAIVVLGPKASPQAVADWNAQNGFGDPVIVQYWHYVYAVLHGNLGFSYKLNQSVAALFGERWARSEDYPVLIAYTLIGAVLTVLGNLLADIALTIADPRIRLR